MGTVIGANPIHRAASSRIHRPTGGGASAAGLKSAVGRTRGRRGCTWNYFQILIRATAAGNRIEVCVRRSIAGNRRDEIGPGGTGDGRPRSEERRVKKE